MLKYRKEKKKRLSKRTTKELRCGMPRCINELLAGGMGPKRGESPGRKEKPIHRQGEKKKRRNGKPRPS